LAFVDLCHLSIKLPPDFQHLLYVFDFIVCMLETLVCWLNLCPIRLQIRAFRANLCFDLALSSSEPTDLTVHIPENLLTLRFLHAKDRVAGQEIFDIHQEGV
jgi:hypothetical protein